MTLILINALRSTPLVELKSLDNLANQRAIYLCSQNFSHQGWTHVWDNTNWKYVGENLAKDFPDEKSTVLAWKNSPSHFANIINKNYKYTGLAKSSCGIEVELFAGH